jgi:hypothetical protein
LNRRADRPNAPYALPTPYPPRRVRSARQVWAVMSAADPPASQPHPADRSVLCSIIPVSRTGCRPYRPEFFYRQIATGRHLACVASDHCRNASLDGSESHNCHLSTPAELLGVLCQGTIIARQLGWPVVLPHPRMLPKRRPLASPEVLLESRRSFRSEVPLPEPCPLFDAARRARCVDVSGRPSSRHHPSATARKACQRRRALSCAAGAEPRAENRLLPVFEHGEHPPFDAPEHRGTLLLAGVP